MKRGVAIVLAAVTAVLVGVLPAASAVANEPAVIPCETGHYNDGDITSLVRNADHTVTVSGWLRYCEADLWETMGLPAFAVYSLNLFSPGLALDATLGTEPGRREVSSTFTMPYPYAAVCLHANRPSLRCWTVMPRSEPAPSTATHVIDEVPLDVRRDPACGNCWRPVN